MNTKSRCSKKAQRCCPAVKDVFQRRAGESQLAATIDYVGAEHFLYASDILHWDNEFPENLHDLRDHRELSDDVKRKILYKNAKDLFAL